MTRLDAIKTALRGLDPSGFVEDMAWLLAQVEALAKTLLDIKAIVGTPHPSTFSRVREKADAALAALEAPE